MIVLALVFLSLLLLCTCLLVNTSVRHAQRFKQNWLLLASEAAPTGNPFISIVVPMRNEEANARRCLTSLLVQTYRNFELIVVDDNSTDATSAILAEMAECEGAGRMRIVQGKPLEPGWNGKCFALTQGAAVAKGSWLLFTDADTEHGPTMLAAALACAEQRGSDLLSTMPFQECRSFWERVIQPTILGDMVVVSDLFKLVEDPKHPMATANGQFILIRRTSYEAIGGHGHPRLRQTPLEDMTMAEIVKSAGYHVTMTVGANVMQTRMYRSLKEIWEGYTKTFSLACDTSLISTRPAHDQPAATPPALTPEEKRRERMRRLANSGKVRLVATAVYLVFLTIAPFAIFLGSLIALSFTPGIGSALMSLLGLALVGGALYVRAQSTSFFQLPPYYSLTQPLGGLVSLAILCNSVYHHAYKRSFTWKGRQY
jgi:chlorobactene glucosyltransferase